MHGINLNQIVTPKSKWTNEQNFFLKHFKNVSRTNISSTIKPEKKRRRKKRKKKKKKKGLTI